ncbi:uncharacterized protein LOC132294422 isoform X2 [Cornus florida]|nr:uncharacterized protein LOC132294422 isoform X2 [Cornus florida]
MAKLSNLFDGEMVLKYQLIPEDLDTLVSVKSDEDVRHMLEEYDRHESTGTLRLRAFLFPANPIVMDNQTHPMDTHSLEQRYIDAINGIIRANNAKHTSSTNPNPPPHTISSTGSSPKSQESCAIDNMLVLNGQQFHMHKVQSSPSLCGPNSQQHYNNHHHIHQHHHRHYPNHLRQSLQPCHGYQPHRGGGMPTEKLISVRSVERAESWRYQMFGAAPIYHHHSPRHSGGSGGPCDKCSGYTDRRFDRNDSFSHRTESFSPSPQ